MPVYFLEILPVNQLPPANGKLLSHLYNVRAKQENIYEGRQQNNIRLATLQGFQRAQTSSCSNTRAVRNNPLRGMRTV